MKEIYVVVGFKKEQYDYLVDQYGVVKLVVNMEYAEKNNLHSLAKVLPQSWPKRILCRATSGAGKIRFRNMSGIPGIW